MSVFDKFALNKPTGTFNSGADAVSLASYESKLKPYKLPADLKRLYEFSDGSKIDDAILYMSNFLSIEDSLGEYEEIKSLASGAGFYWPDALVPIGAWEGTYLLAELKRESEEKARLYYIDISAGDLCLELVIDGIESFFAALLEAEEDAKANGIDFHDAFVQSKLRQCRDVYIPGQKGNRSKDGIINVFNLDAKKEMPTEWFC